MKTKDTSWEKVSSWYNSAVGESGHYYHQHVVIPNTLKLLQVNQSSTLLDLGCGQGVLARHLPKEMYYQGMDASRSLIDEAKAQETNAQHHFNYADVTRQLPIQKKDFTHVTCILAAQNMEHPERMFQQAATHLRPGGKFVLVLNHPAFRIPRQSSWGIDEAKKTQYRRVDRYLSDLKIPITAHPGKRNSEVTWSFHQPLSYYFQKLNENGFLTETVEEWVSDKSSEGKAAKMENRGRAEIPLFLTIVATKK
jgi:ubiquinone/menaquinone biosynthesis C-methylase UbiE